MIRLECHTNIAGSDSEFTLNKIFKSGIRGFYLLGSDHHIHKLEYK